MRKNIGLKLMLAVSSVTVATIAIFSYIIITSQHQALINQVEYNADRLSETIKGSTKYDMLLNQREGVHRIIDSIGEQKGIEKVRIFNKEGKIIYSSDKGEIGQLLDKEAESCYACHRADEVLEKLTITERTRVFEPSGNGSKSLGIINPIYNEAGCWQADCHAHAKDKKVLGVLDVTMSLAEVENQIAANEFKMVLLTISAIAATSLLIWWLVQSLVGKPVSQLVQGINMVAIGRLDYKIGKIKDGELAYLGDSFNKMTARLADAQRQLYHSEKLASLGRLAAGVAHEINNPLTGVLAYSSFLLKRLEGDGESKEDLEVIVRETKRCRDIVKGLLDFSRQAPQKKHNLQINEVILNTLAILQNQFAIKGIDVVKKLSPDLPAVYVDSGSMQQVFTNLLVNAIDAIGKTAGQIIIETKNEGGDGQPAVRISVSDTGSGIDKKHFDKIFDPFFSTKGQKGTGLGLAVVWGVIEEHGGKIDVKSEVGKGTNFLISLPVTAAAGNNSLSDLMKDERVGS